MKRCVPNTWPNQTLDVCLEFTYYTVFNKGFSLNLYLSLSQTWLYTTSEMMAFHQSLGSDTQWNPKGHLAPFQLYLFQLQLGLRPVWHVSWWRITEVESLRQAELMMFLPKHIGLNEGLVRTGYGLSGMGRGVCGEWGVTGASES